jgi:hypothetical protein
MISLSRTYTETIIFIFKIKNLNIRDVMEAYLTDYEIYTYKNRENIEYVASSKVESIEPCKISNDAFFTRVKLVGNSKLFYCGNLNNISVDDKVEVTYKLIVEDQSLMAYTSKVKKI